MRFLPIVQRELRVASRRRGTFRMRFLAAVAAAGVGGLFVALSALPGWIAPSGRPLFVVLTVVGFAFALFSGALLTADCLSREKREGTLGFLFLTDLNGFDVVAGKFAALGLLPLHALLAAVPVAAMTVFMGGVTAGELWRVSLVVLNTLFLSLSLGMCISSLLTDDRRAVGLTLGVLALALAAPWLMGRATALAAGLAPLGIVRWASPVTLLESALAGSAGPGERGFWRAFGFQHVVAWGLLGVAAAVVRHSWRVGEGSAVSAPAAEEPGGGGKRPGPGRRSWRPFDGGAPGAFGGVGPGGRRGAWWMAGLTLVAALALFGVLAAEGKRFQAGPGAIVVLGGGFFLLKLSLAIQTAYALQESCRSGAMELLLVTPVPGALLWEGHLGALRAAWVRPVLMLGVAQVALAIAGGVLAGGDWPSVSRMVVTVVAGPLLGLVAHALDFIAVAYHASRWALHYDRPWKAVARTTLLVLVLPGVFCSYGRILIDLFIIGRDRPRLDRFRELVQRWFFPGPWGPGFGTPRL